MDALTDAPWAACEKEGYLSLEKSGGRRSVERAQRPNRPSSLA